MADVIAPYWTALYETKPNLWGDEASSQTTVNVKQGCTEDWPYSVCRSWFLLGCCLNNCLNWPCKKFHYGARGYVFLMHYEYDTAECSGLLLDVNPQMRRNNRNRFLGGMVHVDKTRLGVDGEVKCLKEVNTVWRLPSEANICPLDH
jgi:hypothetical protein